MKQQLTLNLKRRQRSRHIVLTKIQGGEWEAEVTLGHADLPSLAVLKLLYRPNLLAALLAAMRIK